MHESAFEINNNIAIYDGYTDGTHWIRVFTYQRQIKLQSIT